MKIHDATETAYKNGYRQGVEETERFFQKRRRETWIKKYLLSVIAYFLIAAICAVWVCAFCKNAKEEAVGEIKAEIQKSVEPKIIKIIEREGEPEAETEGITDD